MSVLEKVLKKKKKLEEISIFLREREKKNVSFLKYVGHFDLSLDENFFETVHVKRKGEIKIRAEWWKSFRGITNF